MKKVARNLIGRNENQIKDKKVVEAVGKILEAKNSKLPGTRAFGRDLTQVSINQSTVRELPPPTKRNQKPELQYIDPITKHITSIEDIYYVDSDCVKKHIQPNKRSIFIDYMSQQCCLLGLRKDTLFMAVYLFDRVAMSKIMTEDTSVLTTAACMLIAAKYEEIYPPELKTYANIEWLEEIVQTESQILSLCNFDLAYPSPSKFIEHWAHILTLNESAKKSAMLLAQLFLYSEKWTDHQASIVAAAAIALSYQLSGESIDISILKDKCDLDQVKECLKTMLVEMNKNKKAMKNIKRRYPDEIWHRFAN